MPVENWQNLTITLCLYREATLKRHVEYVHDQSGEYTTSMGDGSDNETNKAGEEEASAQEELDPTDTDFNFQEELRVTTKSSTKEVQVEHIPAHQVEERGDRPYACNICGNRFKEVWLVG